MLLVIDRRDTCVSYENKTLCIRRADDKLQRIPLNMLEQVVVYGSPTIEMAVWRALSEAAIPATVLSHRGSQAPAIIASGLAVRLPLRRLQYRCAEQPSCAIAIARWLVNQKFSGYDLLMPLFSLDQQQAFRQQRSLLQEKLNFADSIDSIMGCEGALAHTWFSLLTTVLPDKWRFTGRNRQPPRDPFNALLSLGYTLLMSDIRQVLISEGLDPAFGFLHQPLAGREALLLDFTELFRGNVDLTMYLFLERVNLDDFSYSQAFGCRLTKAARPMFFQYWSEFREQCPRLNEKTEIMAFTPLVEQVRGKVATFREVMKAQDKNNNV